MSSNQGSHKVTDLERAAYAKIFLCQRSDLMARLAEIPYTLNPCCLDTIGDLESDFVEMCIKTKESNEMWKNERRIRITGTTCYPLYTHSKNKNPNWEKKCNAHLNKTNFYSKYTEYGRAMEGAARKLFVDMSGKIVIQTGLVVCQLNPWLAVSPDGVIFENEVATEILEIKCPWKGKTLSIKEAVQQEFSKCLDIVNEEEMFLKKKHTYYAQVQLNMAVLNVQRTSFMMYSPFNDEAIVIQVPFDVQFTTEMLTVLKFVYYNFMLHCICQEKKENTNGNAIL